MYPPLYRTESPVYRYESLIPPGVQEAAPEIRSLLVVPAASAPQQQVPVPAALVLQLQAAVLFVLAVQPDLVLQSQRAAPLVPAA